MPKTPIVSNTLELEDCNREWTLVDYYGKFIISLINITMKNLVFVVLLILVASCAQPTEPAGPSEIDLRNEANTKVVYAYIDAISNNNVGALGDMLSDEFWNYGPGINDSTNKAQTIATWQTNWDSLVTNITYERLGTGTENPTEGPNAGDWVMDWANVTVDYQDGTSATFMFNGVFMLENGKIIMSASIYDRWDMLDQRGFTLNPPGAGG